MTCKTIIIHISHIQCHNLIIHVNNYSHRRHTYKVARSRTDKQHVSASVLLSDRSLHFVYAFNNDYNKYKLATLAYTDCRINVVIQWVDGCFTK